MAGLPLNVAAALADPPAGDPATVDAEGTSWATLAWGEPANPPLLLVHGVTSNAGIWWRVAPALAAVGWRVVAVDMPGHGRTTGWHREHAFPATAARLAAFVRAAGIAVPSLGVVGHSWGAMVAAHLPAAGIRPGSIALLDPPLLTLDQLRALTQEPTEHRYDSLDEARAVVRATNPTWSDRDVEAKAQALTEFDEDLVRAVLLENGDWDAGMAALQQPEPSGVAVTLIRGEWATGGFIPDDRVPVLEANLGAGRVVTIPDAPHSPQRTHPRETLAAILDALR